MPDSRRGSFIDSNVLLYLASGDAVKANRAEQIVRQGGTISVQVLNEITNVARRKMGLSWTEIATFLALVRGLLEVRPVTVEVHETGLSLAQRYGLSTYDAMIAAAGLLADAETLWSEDMQHGMLLDGRLRIVDPFRTPG
jgi:predicted nucleic acid-binding protein